ncbi:MAG: hypothetical protein V1869_00865 [Candidatus Omnitrophota bacterium]
MRAPFENRGFPCKKALGAQAGCGRWRLLVTLFLLCFFSISLAQEDFVYQPKGRRNPFIPLVTKDGQLLKLDRERESLPDGLSVDGIIYDKQGVSYALVNGRVIGVGDYAGDYRVLKIEDYKVTFLIGGQVKEVPIYSREEN